MPYVKSHSVHIKATAGAILWGTAIGLIVADSADGRLGILFAFAAACLAFGLAFIILAVVDWQARRTRGVLWALNDVLREPETPSIRLVKGDSDAVDFSAKRKVARRSRTQAPKVVEDVQHQDGS